MLTNKQAVLIALSSAWIGKYFTEYLQLLVVLHLTITSTRVTMCHVVTSAFVSLIHFKSNASLEPHLEKDTSIMSETSLEQTPPADDEQQDFGSFGVMEVDAPIQVPAPAPSTIVEPPPPAAFKRSNRSATVEHLAARQAQPSLDQDSSDVRQALSDLRSELTTLVTDLRWGGTSVETTVEQLTPLLDFGPLTQWIPVLIPTILEIDRAGNLVPAWVKLAEEEDPADLPSDANPAETTFGRARRIAILMLGYYKTPELSKLLGKLASDPHSSLYACQALVKQTTVAALQGLVSALKDAKGWAKVDVMDAFATLNQSRFYEIMLASGLEDAEGLESYIAAPLYRTVPLENYLRGENGTAPRVRQQATLVVAQVLQDHSYSSNEETLPVVFERDLSKVAAALFEGATRFADWRNAVALHRLGMLLGTYWSDISRGVIPDARITGQVYNCLPLMPSVEQWMNGPGRNALLDGLTNDDAAFLPCLKVLRDLREPRTAGVLLAQLELTTQIEDRNHALRIGQMCDTLIQLGDRRAVATMFQLAQRLVPVQPRAARARRSDNLPTGAPEIPASIVYGAALRTFAQFRDRGTLDLVLRAAGDFDPYVRTQALEALKNVDPQGEDPRSRSVARDLLNDPRDTVVRAACQIVAQYRDVEAIPLLSRLEETHPEYSSNVQDALRLLR
jgi:HEAT repeat protein